MIVPVGSAEGKAGNACIIAERLGVFYRHILSIGLHAPTPPPPGQRNDHGSGKPYFEQGRPDWQRHQAEKAEHDRDEDRPRKIDAHEQARLGRRDRNVAAECDGDRGGEPQ